MGFKKFGKKMNFITGNKFKSICDYIFDESGMSKTNINNDIPIFFVKTHLIDVFFSYLKTSQPFKLITHNSDHTVNLNHLKYLENKNLIKWYSQNVNVYHKKLISIPIGIANENWYCGDESILINEVKKNLKKTNLIYCNFDYSTNPFERGKCVSVLNKNGISVSKKKPFNDYLNELGKSYFSVSPNGNGIDCHKTWESLYLKTIPIITKTINSSFYFDYPIIILNDWSEFNINDYTPERYLNEIKKYDESRLEINFIINSILN